MASKAMRKGKMQKYNAVGSKAVAAAENETGGFAKGGAKHKDGGKVEGSDAKGRADMKRHKRAAGGRTPYSSGHALSSPTGATNSGKQSERPGS